MSDLAAELAALAGDGMDPIRDAFLESALHMAYRRGELVTRADLDAAVALALEGAAAEIRGSNLGLTVGDVADDVLALIQPHRADALARVRQPLTFGRGEQVVTVGEAHGVPAVFIAPAKQPGTIGADATREGNPRDALVPGEIVLTFPTSEQAQMVADALCNDMARVRQETHNAAIEAAAGEAAGEVAAHGASELAPFVRRRIAALALPVDGGAKG